MGIVKKEGVEGEARRLKNRERRERARFVSQRLFIEDHAPGYPRFLDECCRWHKAIQSKTRPGIYKVVLERCGQVPWCISCTQYQEHVRTGNELRALRRCTPADKQPRYQHIVYMAPLTEDGQGWGAAAAADPKRFKKMVFEGLQDLFGPGIGAVLTYQDFGERAFAKCAPHVDLTLNGWMVNDGQPVRTPKLELGGDAFERIDAAMLKHVPKIHSDVTRGNIHFSKWRTGEGAYRKAMSYQVREIVDLRKLEYLPQRQQVYWHNYRENTVECFDAKDFMAGMAEYQWRLKQWPQGDDVGMELTTRHGHLGDRLISATQKAVGGIDPKDGWEEWERGWLAD